MSGLYRWVGWIWRCAANGKSPLGALGILGWGLHVRQPVRFTLPFVDHPYHHPDPHMHGVGLPRRIDPQSSKAHYRVERRFSTVVWFVLTTAYASFLSLGWNPVLATFFAGKTLLLSVNQLLQELLPSSLLEQVKKKPVTTKLFENFNRIWTNSR